ncbi:tight adherence protein C [Nocardioides sp. J9]|uniref:type II secretion system F family protein n=1 Tax=unclassified Nocardioides TaxID=2615069 RepID=UPI0004B7ED06|nr:MULTISPECIES: type II secretion system F family protein [unclassified Nocardioides]TWH01369.1 tight adherence protein C [Nocardioides sp. J9]
MLLLLGVVLLAGAIAAVSAALVKNENPDGLARALQALEQQGAADPELTREAEPSFADRVIDPLQERALGIGRRVTGADQAERIRRRLDQAGNPRGWTVDRVISSKVLGAVVVPVLAVLLVVAMAGSATMMLAGAIGGAVLGFFAPDLYLYNTAVKRADDLKKTLADAVDLLTISVEAGLGFDAALQHVARHTEGPVAEEFSRVLREMQLGRSRADALRTLGERSDVEDLKAFSSAMVQADAFGVPIGQVLRVQSSEIRTKRRQYAEEKAQQVPVKIMVPLVLFILPCLMIVVIGPAVLGAMDAFNG